MTENVLEQLRHYDLLKDFDPTSSLAIDTEAMGLHPNRDRLCLIQVCNQKGEVALVHFPKPIFNQSPILTGFLTNPSILKIFHYGRFDIALLMHTFKIFVSSVYCTKVASKLSRTYTDKHSLKDLCKEFLGIELEKEEQSSDWGNESLTDAQCLYAKKDVIYLHSIKEKLDMMLKRENRTELGQACFQFLPYRAQMDLMVSDDFDVLRYKN